MIGYKLTVTMRFTVKGYKLTVTKRVTVPKTTITVYDFICFGGTVEVLVLNSFLV